MKSLLFKTVEMCEEWEEKKRSDIQLITGLRDVINEMSDLLIKAETENAELTNKISEIAQAYNDATAELFIIRQENVELIEALRMIDEGTNPYEDESGIIGIDLHKFPLNIIRKYILRKHTEEVKG